MKSYHLHLLHDLHEEDYQQRSGMCADLFERIQTKNLMIHILLSDEETFHTCGKVHRHNCRIWAKEKPVDFSYQWERDSPKVNIWLGMTKSRIYGPFFFAEATDTGAIYLDMLQ
jgi:hypothetical protein